MRLQEAILCLLLDSPLTRRHSRELFRADTDRKREDKQSRMTGGIVFYLSSTVQYKSSSFTSSDTTFNLSID